MLHIYCHWWHICLCFYNCLKLQVAACQICLTFLIALQLQHGQGPAAPQAPVNYFNLPPTGPGAGPRYPSMDPSAMGSHAQREARDSNDGDSQDPKRARRNAGPGDANGNGGPPPGGMPPPGWQPLPPMQFFPGMPPGMSANRPPFPGNALPPGMQAPPQHVGSGTQQ